jgi:hypothetical protein
MTTGIAVSIVGTGLFVRYSRPRSRRDYQRLRAQQTKTTDRRQVVGACDWYSFSVNDVETEYTD